MLLRLRLLLKKEKILVVSALCALLTFAAVPPDRHSFESVDVRVLCLLFCLMTVVAGIEESGAFSCLSAELLKRCRSGRTLGIGLVLLPFFTSMAVTNDVALLTFVPFTLMLLSKIRCRDRIIPVLVLQTAAANLGSMATPVGNPQNLFLYGRYQLTAGEFFSAMLPLTLLSLAALTCASALILPKQIPAAAADGRITCRHHLAVFGLLFVLCLLSVFRLLPCGLLLLFLVPTVFFTDRNILKKPDYALLATFVCFFLVSGNLGRMEAVRSIAEQFLNRSTLLTAVLVSQFISNVPTAVLLSGFTEEWLPLLQGVNIGGLGTPVASLASLITLKLYLASPDAKAGPFLLFFTLVCAAGLILLLSFCLLF